MDCDLKRKLLNGLQSDPKFIPTWYNYDDVGSRLRCQAANRMKDVESCFYLSGAQNFVAEHYVREIIPKGPYDLTLVDLGSGNCSPARPFIDEMLRRQDTLTFYPLDISGDFLMHGVHHLSEDYNNSLVIKPIVADYVKGIEQLRTAEGPKMILWLNGISNLSYQDQVNTFRLLSKVMTDKCCLVFSADITEDRETILTAYNDATGYNKSFIQYAIERLNREERSEIDVTDFEYNVDFIPNQDPDSTSYVRAFIIAMKDIQYPIPGLGVDLSMKRGERLYFHEGAGFSCKYTLDQLRHIVDKAGLCLEETWTDDNKHVAFCRCSRTEELL